MHIPADSIVALVGPSGAGKSTFANLVPRFYDTTSGTVLVDGIDVRDLRQADLRSNIAAEARAKIGAFASLHLKNLGNDQSSPA